VLHCPLSFRASSTVLRSLLLVGPGLISWVPHCTTSLGWALRLGFPGLQQAQRPRAEPWVGGADCTMQSGGKKALLVLRVPSAACSRGKALTLKQGEVMGLRLGEPWHGERVTTVRLALCERCGWPSQVVSDCGSALKQGIIDTLLEAPHRASWISDVRHVVANALKHDEATLSLFQPLQSLCTRRRHRLQQTRLAFLLPPQARAQGRLRSVSRQVEWGLQPLASLAVKAQERSPEATALALALRGLKPFKMVLTPCGRHTPCGNEGMKRVKTPGWRTESMPAWQERRSD
jgi:hypothetical protein